MSALSIVATLLVATVPVAFGAVVGIRYQIPLAPTAIAAEIGLCYTTAAPDRPVWPFAIQSDTPPVPDVSRLRLLEDGRALGPAHQIHATIRTDGGGRYSHWGETIYFSASDGTDPRTNGRLYVARASAVLRTFVIWIWAAAAGLAVLVAVRQRPGASAGRHLLLPSGHRLLAAVVLAGVTVTLSPLVPWSPGIGLAALQVLWLATLAAAGLATWYAGLFVGLLWCDVRTAWRRRVDELPAVELGGRGSSGDGWRLADRIDEAAEREGWRRRLGTALLVGIPCLAFVVVLRLPPPDAVLRGAYLDVWSVGAPFGLLLWWTYRRSGWTAVLLSCTATLVLFALPLAALWQHVVTHGNAVGGLLPFSDASGYYYDARRLLDGHPLGWSARRPLFVGALATLLWVTGQHLMATLAVFVAINAFACVVLAREVRASHGALSAAVVTLVVFLFYRVDGGAGTVLTEHVGLAFGTLGTAILWRGGHLARPGIAAVGIGLVTLGLMARAGSFFAVPAMLLLGTWAFSLRGLARRFFASTVAAVGVAAALSLGLVKVLADPVGEQGAFSNFSYSLYGLVVGGKGWRQVTLDHPAAREGPEIYARAVEAFLANPAGLAQGSVRMWAEYLSPSRAFHAFAFVGSGGEASPAVWLCYALCGIGLALMVRRARRPEYALVAAATLGHLASIPFVPPIDAGLRVYAATMPVIAIVVGVGVDTVQRFTLSVLAVILGRPRRPRSGGFEPSDDRLWTASMTLAAVTVGLALVGPLVVKGSTRPPALVGAPCPTGQREVFVRQSPGSYLRVRDQNALPSHGRVQVPDITAGALLASAGRIEIANDTPRFVAGVTMMNVYDLKAGQMIWLVAPTDLLPDPPGILRICGHDSTDAQSRRYGVLYADGVTSAGIP